MNNLRKTLSVLFTLFLIVGMISCGSSSSGGDGDDTDTAATTEDNATNLAKTLCSQAATSATYSSANISAPYLLAQKYTCDTSGDPYICDFACTSGSWQITISQTTNDIEFDYDTCVSGTTYTDGTLTMDYDAGPPETLTLSYGSSFTEIFDYGESDALTVNYSGDIVMEYDSSDYTITFNNFSSSDSNGDSFSVSGSLTMDSSNVMNGTMTITDGSDSVTCTFTNFDVDTATDTDWDNACS